MPYNDGIMLLLAIFSTKSSRDADTVVTAAPAAQRAALGRPGGRRGDAQHGGAADRVGSRAEQGRSGARGGDGPHHRERGGRRTAEPRSRAHRRYPSDAGSRAARRPAGAVPARRTRAARRRGRARRPPRGGRPEPGGGRPRTRRPRRPRRPGAGARCRRGRARRAAGAGSAGGARPGGGDRAAGPGRRQPRRAGAAADHARLARLPGVGAAAEPVRLPGDPGERRQPARARRGAGAPRRPGAAALREDRYGHRRRSDHPGGHAAPRGRRRGGRHRARPGSRWPRRSLRLRQRRLHRGGRVGVRRRPSPGRGSPEPRHHRRGAGAAGQGRPDRGRRWCARPPRTSASWWPCWCTSTTRPG